jgi:hypothetical protein
MILQEDQEKQLPRRIRERIRRIEERSSAKGTLSPYRSVGLLL